MGSKQQKQTFESLIIVTHQHVLDGGRHLCRGIKKLMLVKTRFNRSLCWSRRDVRKRVSKVPHDGSYEQVAESAPPSRTKGVAVLHGNSAAKIMLYDERRNWLDPLEGEQPFHWYVVFWEDGWVC